MGWNDAYWKNRDSRKVEAARHHELMLKTKADEIAGSVKLTKEYYPNFRFIQDETNDTQESIVVNMDTVSAVFAYGSGDDKTAVLNFASYKNPGGGFLAGSSAQEEALCMESILYEVLSDHLLADYYDYNNQHKNKALYLNRGLYSPGIVFGRNGKETAACVLTVAAPNRKAYLDYINNASEMENLEVLRDRIRFVSEILNSQGIETAILGAYGCGVFGQDPEVVAGLFKEYMAKTNVKKVIYAVIDKGGHSKEGAYAVFHRVMR